jgi:hypothetical protein
MYYSLLRPLTTALVLSHFLALGTTNVPTLRVDLQCLVISLYQTNKGLSALTPTRTQVVT